jgi:hypothetical protein
MVRFGVGMIIIGAWAIASAGGLPDTSSPAAPGNDLHRVVAEALRQTIANEKGLPCFRSLTGKDTLNILAEAECGRLLFHLTRHSLPHIDSVRFRLLTREEVLEGARLAGQLQYLYIRIREMSGSAATISVSLGLAERVRRGAGGVPDMDVFTSGSESCVFTFRKEGGEWFLLDSMHLFIESWGEM